VDKLDDMGSCLRLNFEKVVYWQYYRELVDTFVEMNVYRRLNFEMVVD
jgi:hypothetical protein